MVMTKLLCLLLVAVLSAVVVNASPENSFIGSFTAGGADGYFEMKIRDGLGYIQYLLDLTNFNTSCDLSSGLTYHLHSYWTDDAHASVSTCATAGGHYDPYLACGTSSEDKAGLCLLLNRTVDQGYVYSCNQQNYASGHHSLCEVGDFSGKFGRMLPTEAGSRVFKAEHVDPSPPLAANWLQADAVSRQWASVVVHCPADNARLVCSQLNREKCSPGNGVKC